MELEGGLFHLKPSLRKEVCIDRAVQVECCGKNKVPVDDSVWIWARNIVKEM